MQIKLVAHAYIVRRHDYRHPVRDEANVAHKSLIQNVVNRLPVVTSTVWLTRNLCSLSWCEVAHAPRVAPATPSRKRQSGGIGILICLRSGAARKQEKGKNARPSRPLCD